MNKLNDIINRLNRKYNLDSLDISSSSRELILMLICDLKGCNITDIKLNKIELTNGDLEELDERVKKVALDKVPPQYLSHIAYLYNESYYVDENVLIPRQDTETLIEEAIKVINTNKFKNMLDVCTGTGAIGISIAKNSNIQKVTLLDISSKALDIANINIIRNECTNKCITLCSNMFEKLYATDIKYDIITANPPYLTNKDMNEISEFVKKEPSLALYGGNNGLDKYEELYLHAKNYLYDGGYILVEIGAAQAEDVMQIISKYECYIDVQVIKDINSKDRVIKCRFQKK